MQMTWQVTIKTQLWQMSARYGDDYIAGDEPSNNCHMHTQPQPEQMYKHLQKMSIKNTYNYALLHLFYVICISF